MPPGDSRLLGLVRGAGRRDDRVRHVERLAARAGRRSAWPAWADAEVVEALRGQGIEQPWEHQARAADLVHAGEHVVLATGTASGKSLAYLLPALTAVRRERGTGLGARRPTALYLAPTKALAADQLARVESLRLPGVRAATYDGDTAPDERRWIRDHASFVLTNPDLLHHSLLPGHERWARFLRGLEVVVIDECHHYRGVFGAHVAAVVRRLRRIAARYGASPTFVLASATVSAPAEHAGRLTGLTVTPVTDDASPRGQLDVVLWEPPLLPGGGEHDAPTRRGAAAETADLLADLACAGVRSLAFVRSRRGAEHVAATARRLLAEVDPDLAPRVAAYRGGYLPEERRALERRLRNGDLLAVAATNALELGVDVTGLDAVLLAGWPGRRSSLWQQAGRAGREGQDAVAVLVAADDPLDTYLVTHPEAVFGSAVEATVLDEHNPYVLGPHLAAAAAELPLTDDDLTLFGEPTRELLDVLVARGVLRRRRSGWYWARSDRAAAHVDLRGTGGPVFEVVEEHSGRVLGTVDSASADRTVHEGAVYVHQGDSYVVRRLDLAGHVALVEREAPPWTTQARTVTDVRILQTSRQQRWGPVTVAFGTVQVTGQVVSFLRRRLVTGEVLGEEPLDLPPRDLRTKAVWWTAPEAFFTRAGVAPADLPGALHAAEHTAIGLLPLLATCDRWDVGGVSTALHPDTGQPTVVVHDGHPGGAGFAERGYTALQAWLRATAETLGTCACPAGCPSCVQSPKCGNGNEPLDKAAALRVVRALLGVAPDSLAQQDDSGTAH
ncbi:DEAD/DEAH box helicase [Angustibacter sp. Root456]|uniref:DEAD/DEAH box helicase n=1 Tax=Angustibacter sp. Root456 TaxID=1736539 RepID=UPI000A64A015